MATLYYVCLALTIGALVVTSIAVAVVIGQRVSDSGLFDEDKNCSTIELDKEIRSSNDYIGLIFLDCPTEEQLSAFVTAQDRWNGIIASNKLEPTSSFFATSAKDYCRFLVNGFFFPFNFRFDHLIIFAEPIKIDGIGSVLAQAAPCAYDDNGMPMVGGMQFDTDDLDQMSNQILVDVVTHEMGHVLGLGTLWDRENLLRDPVFVGDEARPENVPKYTGTSGLSEFTSLGGSEDFVPVEDGRDGNSVLLDAERGQGIGSIDRHWKKSVFDDELMVYSISGNIAHPLSSVTLGALEDLGYDVDMSQADEYQLDNGLQSLRGGDERVDFGDDTSVFDVAGYMPIAQLWEQMAIKN